MKKYRVLIGCSFALLFGCSAKAPLIVYSPLKNYEEIDVEKSFLDLKADYSVTKEISFGPDPEEAKKSLTLAKKNVYYDAPDRRVVFTATIWDLPLIKAYMETQKFTSRSSVGQEVKNRLIDDLKDYLQIMISVDSYVNQYFNWSDWTIWLEDRFGRTYVPPRTDQSSETETVFSTSKSVLGREKTTPETRVFHDYGTLYFNRLDLEALSPVRLILVDTTLKRKIELPFRVKGKPAVWEEEKRASEFVPPLTPPRSVTPEPEAKKDLAPEEKKVLMKEYFLLATERFQEGRYEEAIRLWEKVLELDPSHQLSKVKIEKAQARLPDPAPAQEEPLEEAKFDEERVDPVEEEAFLLEQKKKRMKIHFLLATDYFQEGNYEQAIEEWENVLALDEDHALSKIKIEKARERLAEEGWGEPQTEKEPTPPVE